MRNKKNAGLSALNKKCVIVFSGFNQRAVIAFLRTLEKNDVDYVIIAKSEEDDIFLTNYKHSVLAVRKSVSLVLEDLIESIKAVQRVHKREEYVIAPTTEALNRFLLEKRESFEKMGCSIPLVDKNLYELISNKYSFGRLCYQHGILVPKEININHDFELPLVAKPKKYFSSINGQVLSPIIIYNSHELEKFISEYKLEDFYFQEYVNGKSIYLLYYFHRNGTTFRFSQENLVQQPNGKSMVAAISSNFHHSEESCKYEKLFRNLKFFGLVMVEVRQHNDKNYMIEANPRFWGPSQLFVDAGTNFFEPFLHDFGLIESYSKFIEPTNIIRYFWFGGVSDTIRKNERLIFHYYNEIELSDLLPEWIKYDIYRRPDTRSIFIKEVFSIYGDK